MNDSDTDDSSSDSNSIGQTAANSYVNSFADSLSHDSSVDSTSIKQLAVDISNTLGKHNSSRRLMTTPILNAMKDVQKLNSSRFMIDDPVMNKDKIEDIFSIKKNGQGGREVDRDENEEQKKENEKLRSVINEKENPEFVWIKQYTKVYNVNDPATTFPIFSNNKYNYTKKKTPKGNSMPLVAPSDVENMTPSSLNI